MCPGKGPTTRQGAAGTSSTGKTGIGEQVLRRDEEVRGYRSSGLYYSQWEILRFGFD